jgi:hypothetical protein
MSNTVAAGMIEKDQAPGTGEYLSKGMLKLTPSQKIPSYTCVCVCVCA